MELRRAIIFRHTCRSRNARRLENIDHEKSNKLYWASSKQTLTASLKNLRMHLHLMEPTLVNHMLENQGLQIRKCSNQLCWEGGRQARQLNTEHTSAGPCRHQQVGNLVGNLFWKSFWISFWKSLQTAVGRRYYLTGMYEIFLENTTIAGGKYDFPGK